MARVFPLSFLHLVPFHHVLILLHHIHSHACRTVAQTQYTKLYPYLSFKAKASWPEMIGWLNQVRRSTTSTLSKPTATAVFSKKLDLIQMIQIFKSIDGGSQMAIEMDLRDANRAIRFGYLNYLNQMAGKEASGRRVQRRCMVM